MSRILSDALEKDVRERRSRCSVRLLSIHSNQPEIERDHLPDSTPFRPWQGSYSVINKGDILYRASVDSHLLDLGRGRSHWQEVERSDTPTPGLCHTPAPTPEGIAAIPGSKI